ncbi:hypothetical protein BofuT4_P071230.1 [Botrytis cinerea T4]|uniref:Uncharacterized protein n=1 Tax=Botryotinia fuckeliana (strain T4) TaxID=999810 RepID=G2XPT9_BOTF4|nr:hypothetical protein BofuT4_P071230.1 [Botrytis cinerea T4]
MALQREELQTNQRPRNSHANSPSSDSSSSSSSGFKSDETSSEEDVSSEEVENCSGSKEAPEIYSKEPALYKGESRNELNDWRGRCEHTVLAKPRTSRYHDKNKLLYAVPCLEDDITQEYRGERKRRSVD